MFPSITNADINKVQHKESIKKSFLFDFELGDFVVRDGKLVEVEDIEAIKIWIEKIIRTEKFRYKIYEKDDKRLEYGLTLKDLIIGNNYPINFVESEVKREITEALLKHPLIQGISSWRIEKNNPVLNVTFNIILKDGRKLDKEVSF